MMDLTNLSATQSAMLRVLRRNGSASRAELAMACGITPAAVSGLSRGFLDRGLIHERGRRAGGRGAPHIDLELSPSAGHALGIHATRQTISVALLDFCGSVISETHLTGRFDRFADACAAMAQSVAEVQTRAPDPAPLIGAGIAVPARFFEGGTRLDLAEEVSDWQEENPSDKLRALLQCPVQIENDANAAAIGELVLGNHDAYRDFTYLYLSEGIGSALVLNGDLYRGHLGNAGEVGSLCPHGTPRPSFTDFRSYCSDAGVQDIPAPSDGGAWPDFLTRHDAVVQAWVERAALQVSQIIFAITTVVAPAAIYVGGTLPLPLRHAIAHRIALPHVASARRLTAPQICLPMIDVKDAVAFGAAAAVLHRL